MHGEKFYNPEQSQPSTEQRLVGALKAAIIPSDDPNRPPDMSRVSGYSRSFRTTRGTVRELEAGGNPDGSWGLTFFPEGYTESGSIYTINIRVENGVPRAYPEGSEIPLGDQAVEGLLSDFSTSVPTRETFYYFES